MIALSYVSCWVWMWEIDCSYNNDVLSAEVEGIGSFYWGARAVTQLKLSGRSTQYLRTKKHRRHEAPPDDKNKTRPLYTTIGVMKVAYLCLRYDEDGENIWVSRTDTVLFGQLIEISLNPQKDYNRVHRKGFGAKGKGKSSVAGGRTIWSGQAATRLVVVPQFC